MHIGYEKCGAADKISYEELTEMVASADYSYFCY